MPNEFTGREPEISPTDAGGAMFGATPVWERNRKKSRFGGKTVAAEPRSFEPVEDSAMSLDRPLTRPIERPLDHPIDQPMAVSQTMTGPTLTADDDVGLVAPIASTRTVKAKHASGASPIAIAAAAGAVALLGAVGWFATRSNDGIPELTPGSTTSEVVTAPIMPPAPAQMAASTVAPPSVTVPTRAQASRTAPARRTAAAARARPAAANAATGVNASASIPAGPQPYSAPATGSVNPAPQPLLVIPTPPPAVEAIPASPPIVSEPAPTTTTADPATPPT